MRRQSLRARATPVLLAAALLGAVGPARARAGEVVLGLMPEVNIFEQKARFRPLGEYLSRALGVPVRFTILGRYGNAVDGFRSERLDGAFFGSFTGALAIERLGVVPIARPVTLDGASTYHAHVFVRRDSNLRTVADLRGKRMAYVDRATTAGYLFPLAWLRDHGVARPESFFAEAFYTGSHDAAIRAVLDGDADVGAAKNTVWDRVAAEDPRVERELLVIAESAPMPSNGLCVRRDLAPALRAALGAALLGMDGTDAGRAVLKTLGALRFVATGKDDYRPVVELAHRAGLDLHTYVYVNE